MKNFIFTMTVAVLAFMSPVVNATPIKWTLGDVGFNRCDTDGTMATGYFVYDAGTNSISDYNIVTDFISTGGYCGDFGGTYSPSTATVGGAVSALELILVDDNGSNLILQFNTLLTDAGGTVDLLAGVSKELNSGQVEREIWTGFLTGTAVPEPGTLALFGIGLAGMGLARRKKV